MLNDEQVRSLRQYAVRKGGVASDITLSRDDRETYERELRQALEIGRDLVLFRIEEPIPDFLVTWAEGVDGLLEDMNAGVASAV